MFIDYLSLRNIFWGENIVIYPKWIALPKRRIYNIRYVHFVTEILLPNLNLGRNKERLVKNRQRYVITCLEENFYFLLLWSNIWILEIQRYFYATKTESFQMF